MIPSPLCIGEPELERLRAVDHPVLAHRVRDHDQDGLLRPDKPGHELRAAPAGEDAEEDLGEAEVPHRGRDRARRAVERDRGELSPA